MRDFRGLLKMAFGPQQTVGQFMNAWNADLGSDARLRHYAFNRINNAGLDVKQPASRIPYVLGGGFLGNAAARYLGSNPFWKGVATVGGALYGNHLYNKNNPDPRNTSLGNGLVFRGF